MRKYVSSAGHLPRVTAAALAAFTVAAMFSQGCSSSEVATPGSDAGAGCNPAACSGKNTCISDGKETKCRLACDAQTGPSGCAANWTCKLVEGAEQPFCVQDPVAYAPSAKGQWGAPCNPQGGFAENPDCDSAQNFWCYGVSPTDAQAFCTQYQCQTDSDCRGGYHCATINQSPSVVATNRSQRLTTTVCLPRTYCSPCTSNVDCAPLPSGAPQYCVAEATGGARYCTTTCTRSANCALDAQCVVNDELGAGVCQPKAGVCKGDGSLCSPCKSDDDCTDGLCVTAPFSTEKFCSVTSKIPCTVENDTLKADCPKAPAGAPYRVSCSTSNSDPEFPQNQCLGIVQFGEQGNIGCWTKAR